MMWVVLLATGCQAVEPSRTQPIQHPTVVLPAVWSLGPHPRLFFAQAEIARLRQQANSTHSSIARPIVEFTTQHHRTSVPAAPPAAASADDFRSYGDQLIAFAFACVLTERVEDCALAKRTVVAYAGWARWDVDEQRDLGLAHMILGSALAYDWLYAQLSESERQLVRASLIKRADAMFEASTGAYEDGWRNWWRRSYWQNHHWTNHAALGVAAIALWEEAAQAGDWLSRASEQMGHVRYILDGIGDGSWHEGILYQNYGLTTALIFWINLARNFEIDLVPHTYLRNYATWRLYNWLPNTTQPLLTYGDFDASWGNGHQAQNILRYGAARYGDGRAEWVAQQLVAADGRHPNVWSAPWYVFEFLYYDATISATAPDATNWAQTFPDLQAVIWRTGWGPADLVFGFKTGPYGGRFGYETFVNGEFPVEQPCATAGCQLNVGHDHDDSNTFYLYRNGQWLATERSAVGGTATALHNAMLIDGQGQYRPSDDWGDPTQFAANDARLKISVQVGEFAYLAADATQRYRQIEGLQEISRQILFVAPDYFLMIDQARAETPHRYEWVAHLGESVLASGDWVQGIAGDGQHLGIQSVAPRATTLQTGDDGQPYVRIRPAVPRAKERLIHLVVPSDQAQWASRAHATLLDHSDAASLIRVWHANGQDDLLVRADQDGAPFTLGDYRYDGQVAVIRHNAAGVLSQIFVQGGSQLQAQNRALDLVAGTPISGALAVTYDGDSVAVFASGVRGASLYAPAGITLRVNGIATPFQRTGATIQFVTDGQLP